MLFSFFVLVCKGAEKTDSDNCDESACFIHTTYPLTLKSLSLDQMRTFGTYVIYKDIIFDDYCELHCFFDNVRNDYNEKKDNLVPLMMEEMFVYASRLLFMVCGEQNRYKALDEELNEKFYEKLKSKDCWWKIFEKCKITMTQIRQIDELAKIYKTKKHILLRQVMFVVDSLYEILQEYPNDRLYIAQRLHDYMLRECARQTIVASGHDLRKLPCRFFVNSFGDKPVHDLETNYQTTLSMANTLNAKNITKFVLVINLLPQCGYGMLQNQDLSDHLKVFYSNFDKNFCKELDQIQKLQPILTDNKYEKSVIINPGISMSELATFIFLALNKATKNEKSGEVEINIKTYIKLFVNQLNKVKLFYERFLGVKAKLDSRWYQDYYTCLEDDIQKEINSRKEEMNKIQDELNQICSRIGMIRVEVENLTGFVQ